MRRWTVIVGLILQACAGEPKEMPMAIDTFCLQNYRTYDALQDSPETIRDAKVFNETLRRRCGKKPRLTSVSRWGWAYNRDRQPLIRELI